MPGRDDGGSVHVSIVVKVVERVAGEEVFVIIQSTSERRWMGTMTVDFEGVNQPERGRAVRRHVL